VGVQHLAIDLSDNTDVGFYASGSHYEVILYPDETVDSQNVSKEIGSFDIGPQNVNVQQVSGDSGAADNMELDYDGTGYNKLNSTIGTCTTNTDMVAEAPTAVENREEMDSNSTQLIQIASDVVGLAGDAMRGTENAFLAASAPSNFSALGIEANGNISVVDLVGVTSVNADMRGTDGAFLAASAPTNFSALGIEANGNISVVDLVAVTTENTDMVAEAPTVSDILNTAQLESYSDKGDPPTMYQASLEILAELRSFSFTGTTQTVKRLDGTTTAYTNEIDNATTPTSKVRLT